MRPGKRQLWAYARTTVVATALMAGCTVLQPDMVRPGSSPSDPSIVVLRSSDNPLFEVPMKWFLNTVQGSVAVFTTGSHAPDGLTSAVRERHPQLVLALGSAAAVPLVDIL